MMKPTSLALLALLAACSEDSPAVDDTGEPSGSGDDTGVAADVGLGIYGWAGSATVDGSLTGTEDSYAVSVETAEDLCRVRAELSSVSDVTATCEDCAWAFEVTASNPTTTVDAYCPSATLGGIDGDTWRYGWVDDYGYGYPYLMYYLDYGTGDAYWIGATGDVTVDGSTYTWDWPVAYFYYDVY